MNSNIKKTRKVKWFFLIPLLVVLTSIFVVIYFTYTVNSLNLIPNKYFITGIFIISAVFIILLVPTFFIESKFLKIFSSGLFIVMDILFLLLVPYLNDTNKFIGNLTATTDYLSYSVVTLKNTYRYSDLLDKTMGYLEENLSDETKQNIDIDVQFVRYKDIFEMYRDLLSTTIDSFVIDTELLSVLEEQEVDLYEKIEVVKAFNLEVKLQVSTEENDITKEPFILYISGIDQYGDVNTTRGRSDVNILAVVNPKVNKILLVNTPRDYYVQLYGTTGLRDKLTHAGIYGIDKSINTLQELYDINIDHYLRINFNTLITLIDEIGGIDIEADKSFTCHTNKNVHINKGWNHLDGTSALAYSRERYAYIAGDHHRGRNQEQVITAIIDKVTSSMSLITKYSKVMETLSNSFQTDMSSKTITSFMKYQIEYMPKWDVESTAVTGSNSMNYTYSMGTNYLLYVMEPDYESVKVAKQNMQDVLLLDIN